MSNQSQNPQIANLQKFECRPIQGHKALGILIAEDPDTKEKISFSFVADRQELLNLLNKGVADLDSSSPQNLNRRMDKILGS